MIVDIWDWIAGIYLILTSPKKPAPEPNIFHAGDWVTTKDSKTFHGTLTPGKPYKVELSKVELSAVSTAYILLTNDAGEHGLFARHYFEKYEVRSHAMSGAEEYEEIMKIQELVDGDHIRR